MHIPDGYLSPKTCLIFYGAMIPVWYFASKKVESSLKIKELPLLALSAAFVFVIMMFNIPIPGGSSGHMVGGAVVAIVLGPWAGVVAISITLALQAFLFGDGGITSLAANCFNMAFLMSFTGYYTYRVLSLGEAGASRRLFASAVAGYVAVNAAALAAAFELGIQPLIAHASDGRPLYAPYPLSVAIPAMALPHLLFFGLVEALGTALIVNYIFKTNGVVVHKPKATALSPIWAFLVILIILTPLGLISSGTPWGEWGKEEIMKMFGYVPSGMEELQDRWSAPLSGYSLPWSDGSVLSYMFSAFAGSLSVIAAVYLWGKLWRRR